MNKPIRYCGLGISDDKIADFCRCWRIIEFALFGSVLRDDFQPDSDIDVLATFAPNAEWGLFDHVQMEQELASLFGREVNVVSRQAVVQSQNWIRRREILRTAQVVYAPR